MIKYIIGFGLLLVLSFSSKAIHDTTMLKKKYIYLINYKVKLEKRIAIIEKSIQIKKNIILTKTNSNELIELSYQRLTNDSSNLEKEISKSNFKLKDFSQQKTELDTIDRREKEKLKTICSSENASNDAFKKYILLRNQEKVKEIRRIIYGIAYNLEIRTKLKLLTKEISIYPNIFTQIIDSSIAFLEGVSIITRIEFFLGSEYNVDSFSAINNSILTARKWAFTKEQARWNEYEIGKFNKYCLLSKLICELMDSFLISPKNNLQALKEFDYDINKDFPYIHNLIQMALNLKTNDLTSLQKTIDKMKQQTSINNCD